AGALRDGDQHNIHQANAADSQRGRSHQREKNLQAHGDDLPVVQVLHGVPNKHSARIFAVEAVKTAQHAANVAFSLFKVGAGVVEPDAVKVFGVAQVAHGGKWNVHDLVNVVVTFLHFGFEHADNFKTYALDAHALAQRGHTGKKFALGV